ncbi:MAG: preprotein translocase subunit SecA [Clostridiales bacterium]|nr:preprotein translocase subunit SecA [Clostridiales bacterium]
MGLLDFLLGNTSESKLKKLRPLLAKINALEPEIEALSDIELKNKTAEFKNRLNNGEKLDDLLVEAFAVVREASKRTVGMRPFDVQMLGAAVLHQGRIAEMKTGEGKTLVAVMPTYLNALTGKGVFVITSNDYLAKRDAQWMGKIHRFLGLTVGVVVADPLNAHTMQAKIQRQLAYACDVIYASHSEVGFDYLRDNMAIMKESLVQREYYYAIVDEVDSILIDEAKTPLIISGPSGGDIFMYDKAEQFVSKLEYGGDLQQFMKKESASSGFKGMASGEDSPEEQGDYMVDYKGRTAVLTQQGIQKAEKFFEIDNLSDADMNETNNYILQALKAHALFERDKSYVLQDNQVIIVDEFTGRLMHGRRYSDGLHQAIEAKEKAQGSGVEVRSDDQTLASITYQNLFRLFPKLAGMTGTAKTEEEEFQDIYDLDVVEIPTNKPSIRIDLNDYFYKTVSDKFDAIVKTVAEIHKTGQPILIGTATVTMSEKVSKLLGRNGIKHEVLNAKNHAREALIIAQAGKIGSVTIATNMAGRGTDILLGGNPDFLARRDLINSGLTEELVEEATSHSETNDDIVLEARELYKKAYDKHKIDCDKEHDEVVAVGGLCIIGTERHESRRIDNQLRGRAARQGDPGITRFFISAEDDMIKRFGADNLTNLLATTVSNVDGGPLDHRLISKTVEIIQKRVEANNFSIRKYLLEYDDVMNKMREIIYAQRKKVLMEEDVHDSIMEMVHELIQFRLEMYASPHAKKVDWDIAGLIASFSETFNFKLQNIKKISSHKELSESVTEQVLNRYEEIKEELDEYTRTHEGVYRSLLLEERIILLRSVDRHWAMHIDAMDSLRDGIGLRAYGQSDPIVAYRNDGFQMFDEMVANIRETVVRSIFRVTTKRQTNYNAPKRTLSKKEREEYEKKLYAKGKKPTTQYVKQKTGRNDPCPCGSGKKYKHCCGAN